MFYLAGGALGALGVLGALGNLFHSQSMAGSGDSKTSPAFVAGLKSDPTGPSQSSIDSSCCGGFAFSPTTMASLIDAQSQQWTNTPTTGASSRFQALFNLLDADGQISQTEFEKALGSDNTEKADVLFAKLDTDGDGNVSQDELKSALRAAHHRHHHHHRPPPVTDTQQTTAPVVATNGTTDPATSTTTSTEAA